MASRQNRNAPWDTPRNVTEINSPCDEMAPCISPDGRTLWWHDHLTGDISYATRESRKHPFGSPRPIGPPVNSDIWEGCFEISKRWPTPGSKAYFVRLFTPKGVDIYEVTYNPVSPFPLDHEAARTSVVEIEREK